MIRTLRRASRLADVSPVLVDMMQPLEGGDTDRLEARRAELSLSDEEVANASEALGIVDRAAVGTKVASDSSSTAKAGLLARLVERVQPERVVEFGSAFGISGGYLVSALQRAGGGVFSTVEATAARSSIAGETIGLVHAPDVVVDRVVGLFDEQLDLLNDAGFVFIDGNHYAEPTHRYVEAALSRGSVELVVVLDDIAGYSQEMDAAWAKLRRDRRFDAQGQVADVGVLLRGRPAALLRAEGSG